MGANKLLSILLKYISNVLSQNAHTVTEKEKHVGWKRMNLFHVQKVTEWKNVTKSERFDKRTVVSLCPQVPGVKCDLWFWAIKRPSDSTSCLLMVTSVWQPPHVSRRFANDGPLIIFAHGINWLFCILIYYFFVFVWPTSLWTANPEFKQVWVMKASGEDLM